MDHPSSAAVPLVGRSQELDRLVGLLDRIPKGPGQFAFIEGEAGIGKTALLREALRQAKARGFQVLEGAAGELERDRPFGTLAEALRVGRALPDPERVEIARLLGGGNPLGDQFLPPSQVPDIRFRVLEAVIALVERLCVSAPLVLALENLHWADASTLLALDHIGRHLAYLPINLVGTLRPSPHITELDGLVDHFVSAGGLRLVLGPLDQQAVTTLVESMAGRPPGPGLLAAVAQAGGNPLFVKEFVYALGQEGAIKVVEGQAEVRNRVFPPSLRVLILRQLGTLPQEVLNVLRVASVLGSTFSVPDLAVVLGHPSTELVPPLDEAVRAGVLGATGERMMFRHELVREAIYFDLPLGVRTALHAQAGAALAAAGAPLAQAASHLAIGAMPGDERAVDVLGRAAWEAALRAPAVAVGLFERTLELADPADPRRDRLVAGLVSALMWSGRLAEAQAPADAVLAHDHELMFEVRLRCALAEGYLGQGRMQDALREIEALRGRTSEMGSERAQVLVLSGWLRVFGGDLEGGLAEAEKALAEARTLGEGGAECLALCLLCIGRFLAGEVIPAVEFGAQAVRRAGRDATGVLHRYPGHFFWGTALLETDRSDQAGGVLGEGLRVAEKFGLALQLPLYHQEIGLHDFYAGRWDDAGTELETGLTYVGEYGSSGVFCRSLLAVMAVHDGQLKAASDFVTGAEQEFAETGVPFGMDMMMWARALLLEGQGDAEGALAVLENAWQLHLGIGFISPCVRLGVDLVRLALRQGRDELARSVVERLEGATAQNPSAAWRGAALRARGLVDADPGTLLDSVAAYRGGTRALEGALACEDAASALARVDRGEEAVALLGEAIEVFERVPARSATARAEATLRALGVQRGRRGSRRRPATGWDSLTPTELEVVRLAAEGLTNSEIGERLFISRRTVETHLSHVFTKLAVKSRVQLAAEAARRVS